MRRLPHRLAATLLGLAVLVGLPAAARAADVAQPPLGGPLLGSPGLVVAPGTPAPPNIKAKAFVLADATTGTVLAAQNAHGRFRPASTLKMLTAVTLLPLLDPATVYTAVYDDAAAEGSKAGIVPGGTYTVDQLFDAMLLPSGNDGAHALAEVAGGVPTTVAMMNETARRLQADDTHAVNPSGLDADGQLTSAYDLVLIARAGMQRADFRAYVSRKVADFPGLMPKTPGAPRSTFKIYNQNRLLQDGYPGAVGVKTGYTTLAGRTFVGAAERNGHLLIVSIIQPAGLTEPAAKALLDWGFAHLSTPGVGQLVDPLTSSAAAAPHRTAKAVTAGVNPSRSGSAVGSWASWAGAVVLLAGLGLVGYSAVHRRNVRRRSVRYRYPLRRY